MYYESVTDYMDSLKKEYEKAIEDKSYGKAFQVVEFLMWKYMEHNSCMTAYEKVMQDNGIDIGSIFKEWNKYKSEMDDKNYKRAQQLGWLEYDLDGDDLECDHLTV